MPLGGRGIPKDAVATSANTLMSGDRKIQVGLENVVKQWPTPAARDGKGATTDPIAPDGRNRLDQLDRVAEHWKQWPTPRQEDAESSGRRHNRDVSDTLTAVTAKWPTPTVGDSFGAGSRNIQGSNAHPGISLTDMVLYGNSTTSRSSLPVPTSTNGGHECSPKCRRLNPLFVEWLMGWPVGWTDYARPVTAWSHWWQQQRSYLWGSSLES